MTRPNILILCTDQQRFDALRCAGNEHIHTPNIDRLAQQGTLFERCYVQNPVCAPSRATLMTGRYPHNHGLWANGVGLPAGNTLFSKVLADSGYDCGLVGKFHLASCFGVRTERRHDDGFRVWRWAVDPYPRSSQNEYHRWLRVVRPDLWDAATTPGSGLTFDTMPTEFHYSRWIGNETIEFLETGRELDKPFLFIANFFDPHHEFGAPQEYLDRYEPADLPAPVTRDRELDDKPAVLREASRRSYAGHARGFAEYTAEEVQQVRQAYYAMVTLVDDEVGRILTALDNTGQADDTIVVFTSDHGEMLGDHQLMLKGPMMFECAVRVPLIVRWPGALPSGQCRDELVQWVDLAPTLLEAAGAPPLEHAQGASLLPLLRGEQVAWRDWALSEYRNSGHPYDPVVHTTMLRWQDWKVIVHHADDSGPRPRGGELYDLRSDPDELHNLWDDQAHLHDRLRMQERLLDVLVQTEDRSEPREAFF